MEFTKNGGACIQQQIDAAEKTVTITGNYEIEQTILLPSNFHLVLDNCYLKMADNTFCNMFANRHVHEPGVTDENISIEGRGNVILDGGTYNGLSEKNSGKDGRPHISVNNILLFAEVSGFRVSNLHIRNQRWWAMNFIACTDGYIGSIDFLSDATWVDQDGNIQYGLMRDNYEGVRIKNSDGIDIRRGCKNIIIENITGFTEDDMVAITSLPGKLEARYISPDADTDICGIVVRNVVGSAYCSLVRLLCQGGGKLYNVLVDGVIDTSATCPCLDMGGYGVRVGDTHAYAVGQPAETEFYNINIRNVFYRGKTAVLIAGTIGTHSAENIMPFGECQTAIDRVCVN